MYILLYLKWITNKILLYSIGTLLILCGSLDGKAGVGLQAAVCRAGDWRRGAGQDEPIKNSRWVTVVIQVRAGGH